MTIRDSIIASANRLGIDPLDWANVISYETIGTFSPSIRGGKNNKHIGLIQFGENEQKKYKASQDQDFDSQLLSAEAYMKDRGLKPGMGLMDIYSTINAGRPGKYQASDRPGKNVASHVNDMLGGHRSRAANMLGVESYAPSDLKGVRVEYRPTTTASLDQPSTESRPSLPRMGASTILGGMGNEEMYSPPPRGMNTVEQFGDVEDVLDTPEWLGVKELGVDALAPTTPLIGSRPTIAGLDPPVTENPSASLRARPIIAGFDTPSTENMPAAPSSVPPGSTLKTRVIDGKFEQYIDSTPETLAGGAGSDTALGDPEDDLLRSSVGFYRKSRKRGYVDPDLNESVQRYKASRKAPAPAKAEHRVYDPLQVDRQGNPLPEKSGMGFVNLMNSMSLGLSSPLLNAISPEAGQRFDSDIRRFREDNPVSATAGNILGSLPATVAGLGIAGQAIRGVGTATGLARPAAFLTGQSGRFGAGAGQAANKLLSVGAAGALEGAGAEVLQSGLTDVPLSERFGRGAALGAGFGMGLTGAGRLISPVLGSASQGVKEIYKSAEKVFSNPKALPMGGQIAEQQGVRSAHKRLLGGDPETEQAVAWTGELMRSTGAKPTLVPTPTGLAQNEKRVSAFLDEAVANMNTPLDLDGVDAFTNWKAVWDDSKHRGAAYNQLNNEAERIFQRIEADGGMLAGGVVQDITKRQSTLGRIINGPDAVSAAHAEDLQKLLLEMVDRGAKNSPGGPTIKISNNGKDVEGTPSELYTLGRQWWKNQKIAEDSFKNNPSGVADPQTVAKMALKPSRGGLSDEEDDLMRNLVHTAPYMPRVTPQGTAEVAEQGPIRIFSNYATIAAPGGLAAGMAMGMGYPWQAALAIGGAGFLAGAGRNTLMRRAMARPDYANRLMGEPRAIEAALGREGLARRTAIGLGVPTRNELFEE